MSKSKSVVQIEVELSMTSEVGKQIEKNQAILAGIVAPREEENAGVIFLPVAGNENKLDSDQDGEQSQWWDAELSSSKYRKERDGEGNGWPRICWFIW